MPDTVSNINYKVLYNSNTMVGSFNETTGFPKFGVISDDASYQQKLEEHADLNVGSPQKIDFTTQRVAYYVDGFRPNFTELYYFKEILEKGDKVEVVLSLLNNGCMASPAVGYNATFLVIDTLKPINFIKDNTVYDCEMVRNYFQKKL